MRAARLVASGRESQLEPPSGGADCGEEHKRRSPYRAQVVFRDPARRLGRWHRDRGIGADL
jgi:hypothetical protein